MKKLFTLLLLISSLAAFSQADTVKHWTVKNNASLNFSQSYFSNWSAGGESTIAPTGKYSLVADFKKNKHKWSNRMNLALGYSYIGDSKPMKTDDKIEAISLYGRELHPKIYGTVVVTFKSQFAKGFDYKVDSSTYISKFMAPGTFDVGPGVEWKPNDHFNVNFSPATAKWIVVNDQRLADEGSFGLDPAVKDSSGVIIEHAKKVRTMFSAKVIAILKYEIFENVDFATKLELYSDYLNNPQNIDVNWQVNITMKVNSWLNVNINSEMIYDDDIMFYNESGAPIGPKVQFNENLQLGLAIQF